MADNGEKIWNIFSVMDLISRLDKLIAQDQLTPEHIWEAWTHDAELPNRPHAISWDDAPHALQDEFSSHTAQAERLRPLRKWNPTYGIRPPYLMGWLMSNDYSDQQLRQPAFKKLDMDHAALIRQMLDHPFYGVRMRFEAAQYPYLFSFLPEDERWERLEAAVREFSTAIDWRWPAYVAHHWAKDKAVELVRRLITEDAECAGGFLAGENAHQGWLAFWPLQDFLEIVELAAERAPYEACLNRQWIATAIGDRLKNARSFMDPGSVEDENPHHAYGWWMHEHNFHKEFGTKGWPEMVKLINWVLNKTTNIKDSSTLSAASRFMVKQIATISTEAGKPKTAQLVARLLLDLPECNFGHTVLSALVASCKTEELGQAYRWLLTVEQRFSLTRFHVLYRIGEWKENAAYKKLGSTAEGAVRESWIEPAMRKLLVARGWQIQPVEYRRNEKYVENSERGWDAQLKMWDGGVTSVYSLSKRRTHYYGDSLPIKPPREGQIVEMMIPPIFDPGTVRFRNGNDTFRIYDVGDRLMPASAWQYEYLTRFRGY